MMGNREIQVRIPSGISHIDHVGIYADQPERLLRFFTDDLGLPVAFPFVTHPSYATGSVGLGNCFLEITKLGSPPRLDTASITARYQILGFQAANNSLERAITELDDRGVARSGVVPFFAPDATNADPVRLWDNVHLGDPSPRPGIRSITLRVASVAAAEQVLRSRRITAASETDDLAFEVPGTNLTISLTSSGE